MRHISLRAPLFRALLLSAATAACSSTASTTDPAITTAQIELATATVGQPFDLKFGQSADVAGTNLRLTFTRVAGDSRCPTDVVCVWEGDAEIAIRIDRGGTRVGNAELHTSPRTGGLRAVDLDGQHVLHLESVAPATHSSRRIPDAEYVATLLVKGK